MDYLTDEQGLIVQNTQQNRCRVLFTKDTLGRN